MRYSAYCGLLLAAASVAGAQVADIDIPYQKFVLSNGLTVIVHEDHKAPIVAVNVWYHVGSKNEKPGKTGFAHLFEHLMFGGSEHFRGRYLDAMERIGATDLNGTTNPDRTNYFQNVPVSAVDYALWMESDRMGYMVNAIDQKTLDLQRGVVQNEKRQGENQPYGRAFELIAENTHPVGHPYSWDTIGSMEDLNAASLADVKEWFRTYYGPNNAVLVIAGDITPQAAREKVEKYFGDIPPGPPIAKQQAWVAQMTGEHRGIMQDRVPQPRIYKVWNLPQAGAADSDAMDLVSDVLARGKVSRLYKRLVYDDQVATNVFAFINDLEIEQQLIIAATARPGVDLHKVEQAINEEMARFLRDGPTPEEVERVKTQYLAGFVRGVERIGGFGGKSDVLASSQVYLGSPDAYKAKLRRVREATAAELKGAADRWLSGGDYALEVLPYPPVKAGAEHADRSRLPDTGAPPALRLPKLEHGTLSNGLKIVVAERHEIPVVDFTLALDAGFAADQFASPGTGRLVTSLIDGGTATRTALQISDELARLGAQLNASSNLDSTFVRLSALKSKLDPSLALYADVILHPSFPQSDFAREQKQLLAGIQQEKASPFVMALRVVPGLVYGSGHAYSLPLTGSGYEDTVARITRNDLVKFHQTWFKPNAATLVVVGDTTLAEVQPRLEKLFAGWKPGDVPRKNIGAVQETGGPVVYLIDKPGAVQSVIIAANLAPPRNTPDDVALSTLNSILGGTFGSRINMNLREDKHWSYGARSNLVAARGQRPFMVIAPVQTDKTRESLAEIDKELRGVLADRPITQAELDKAKANEVLKLPGSRETMAQVGAGIGEILEYGLPEDYWQQYGPKVQSLTTGSMAEAAREVVHPDHLVWVVVGDRSKVEAGVRDLNLGALKFLNADGKPL